MTIWNPIKVLIVDDETLIRQGIKHLIDWEKEGFTIIGEAANGKEALELIEYEQPHIVITDIIMPLMDGKELTKIIKKQFPHIAVVILSSFGEFDYVRSSFQNGVFDYILKPKLEKESFIQIMHKASNHLPQIAEDVKEDQQPVHSYVEQLLEGLVTGFNPELNEEIVKDSLPHSYYYLIGFKIRDFGRDQSVQFVEGIKKKISSALITSFSFIPYKHYFLKSEKETLFALVNINEELSFTSHIKALSIITKEDCRLAISEPFSNLQRLKDVYQQLNRISEQFFFSPERILLFEKEWQSEATQSVTFHLDDFLNQLKQEDFDIAFQDLKTYLDFLLHDPKTNVHEFKSFLNNILFNVIILLKNLEYEVSSLETDKYKYITSIDQANDVTETLEILNDFIKSVSTLSTRKGYNKNIQNLMNYIHSHYMKPLTLTNVAKHFHFNPSYLSNLFATHNKESFIEYLNKIRINEAKKLLRKNGLTIAEISETVGYSDHSYFCKVFKKKTGFSPSKYKKKHLG
ncbi:response regulator transcription factor [Alkalihalobacillus trypoxylicola]|uniref:response regulator transcription factor n=1 Tax=Alkalihalobacillus trypoxylicola TaxID=519424 RepID=UPI0009EF4442|nr:response regulator transcription factor [Alkalihalobacillus trypoxylicola]